MTSLAGPAIVYTPSVIASSLVQDITNEQSQQAMLTEQLGTGNRVNLPSDNPAAAAAILSINGSLARAQQYNTNATDGLGWLALGNSTVNQVLSSLQQARQAVLSLSGAALAGQSGSLTGIATQVGSVRQQVIGLSNTMYNGQAIFAGTGNVDTAYDSNGNYVGGGSAPTRTVAPGVAVPVSVVGTDIFGSGTTGLIGPTGVLAQLQSDITTGTSASLQQAETTDLTSLDNAITQVASQAAALGANYQRMQAFSQQANDAQTALQQQLSGLDSVNVAQVTTQLSQVQQSFQSALWATAQIQQQTLVQFLG